LNRPFSGHTAAIDVYRLGLVMAELRLGPGLEVLDFGAGSCWLAACFNRLGCRTIAVDISQAALDVGRRLFALDARQRADLEPRFLAYDGHALPLADESVDRIACYDAFHHVPNQDEILRELYRVLRPGGRLVMAEPGEGHAHAGASTFDESRFDVLENDVDVLDLERRARRIGFTDVRVKPYIDPTVDPVPAAAYARLSGAKPLLRVSALRAGIGLVEALRNSLRDCSIVTLTKGPQERDSRFPGVLRAEMRLIDGSFPLQGRCRTTLQARVELENAGDTIWKHDVQGAGGTVFLGCSMLDSTGRLMAHEYHRARLPQDVRPGETIQAVVAVPLPDTPGRFLLRLDPVVDGIIWFSQAGSESLDVAIEAIADEEHAAYRASITLLSEAPRLPAGSSAELKVRIENAGLASWPAERPLGPGSVRLGVQLRAYGNEAVDKDFARADLPSGPISPGQSCEVLLRMRMPPAPGIYEARLDLVQEGVCWFAEHGSPTLGFRCEATSETALSTAPGVLRATLHVDRPEGGVAIAGPGEHIEVVVRARNDGNTVWLAAAEWKLGHVRLGASLSDSRGSRDYWRAPIPQDTAPGQSTTIHGRLPVPDAEGEYVLVFDLVDEGVAWFREHGSEPRSLKLRVARSPAAGADGSSAR